VAVQDEEMKVPAGRKPYCPATMPIVARNILSEVAGQIPFARSGLD
jgi:hypothetical protein